MIADQFAIECKQITSSGFPQSITQSEIILTPSVAWQFTLPRLVEVVPTTKRYLSPLLRGCTGRWNSIRSNVLPGRTIPNGCYRSCDSCNIHPGGTAIRTSLPFIISINIKIRLNVSRIVTELESQTVGLEVGEYFILGKQVATVISSMAQSLPPPPERCSESVR